MRRGLLVLLLALAMLSRCGGKPEADIPPKEAPAVSLPETHPAGSVSAPAIVTEGRAPAEDYELPPSLAAEEDNSQYRMERWASGGVIELLAEDPEADTAFYGLPLYADNSGGAALIRWGDSLAEFDWEFATPRSVPPWMDCFDIDGDGAEELAVGCYWGSGTSVSIYELHILEKSSDGTLTAYTLPESLWREQVPTLFDAAAVNGRIFVILGRELVEINIEGLKVNGIDLDLETASAGLNAGFSSDGYGLSFGGVFCLSAKDSAYPYYVAQTSARVVYRDGAFTLDDFHLDSNYE